MKNFILLTFCLFYILGCAPLLASNSIEKTDYLTVQQWPNAEKNIKTNKLTFAFLTFELPDFLSSDITIFNSTTPSMALSINQDRKREIYLIAQTEESVIGILHEKLGTKTSYEFFEKIGQKNDDSILIKVQEIFGINTAEAYIKVKNGQITAYYIKSEDINNRHIYIITNNDKIIYQLSGFIDDEIYKYILSNISVKK